MSRTPSTSFERKLRRCRRDLTLELFLHEDPFWSDVAALRDRFGIQPTVAVPPATIPFPPNCPEAAFRLEDWASLLPPLEESPTLTESPLSPVARDWFNQLNAVSDRVINEPCRPAGTTGLHIGLWAGFLASSVFYDPPEDALMAYADTFHRHQSEVMVTMPEPGMAGIVVGHPAAHRAYTQFIHALIYELAKRIPLATGVDFISVVLQVYEETPLLAELQEQTDADWQQTAIVVTPETTEEEALAAFRVIKVGMAPRRKGGRPKPDDLLCVQAALWREQGWTIARIAERLDLALEKDEHGTQRRSDTAQTYIKRGRHILAEKRKTPGN